MIRGRLRRWAYWLGLMVYCQECDRDYTLAHLWPVEPRPCDHYVMRYRGGRE